MQKHRCFISTKTPGWNSLEHDALESNAIYSPHFSLKDGVMSAFASDIAYGRWWLQRLYRDACDQGIAIRSAKTGAVEVFALTREDVHEGDLRFWEFAPLNPDVKAKITKAIIFND